MKRKTKSEARREEVMNEEKGAEEVEAPSAETISGSEWGGVSNPIDGQMVTLGTVVYRFMIIMERPFDVQIGADAKESLDNLKKAVDQTGVSGLHYYEGTRGQSLVPLEITL